MTNKRKHGTATVQELRSCFSAGLSIRETAVYLGLSLSGLRQACSLLSDLQPSTGRTTGQHRVRGLDARAHNPFGMHHGA